MKSKSFDETLVIPERISVYVFGSILKNKSPNDLDVVYVYCSKLYESSSVIEVTKSLSDQLEKIFLLNVHPVYLSIDEEKHERFVNETDGVELSEFMRHAF